MNYLIFAIVFSVSMYTLTVSLLTSDCVYASQTIETIEKNRHLYKSEEDYLLSLKPHEEYLLTCKGK